MSALRRRLRKIAPWWRRFRRNGYRLDHCAHCGHRFRWSRDARHSTGSGDGKVYHGPCLAYIHWRRKAEQRLDVLGVVVEIAGVTATDVKQVMELQRGSRGWNRAFAVFHDLERAATEGGETA